MFEFDKSNKRGKREGTVPSLLSVGGGRFHASLLEQNPDTLSTGRTFSLDHCQRQWLPLE
jgi:hypothetical protein